MKHVLVTVIIFMQGIWNYTPAKQQQDCISPWHLRHFPPPKFTASYSIIKYGCQSLPGILGICQNSRSTSVKQVTCSLEGRSGDLTGLGRVVCSSQFRQNPGQSTEYHLLAWTTSQGQRSSKSPIWYSIQAIVLNTATIQYAYLKCIIRKRNVSCFCKGYMILMRGESHLFSLLPAFSSRLIFFLVVTKMYHTNLHF